MAKCLICDKEFPDDKGLHMHLRTHSIRMVEYYQKFFPRKDLHTGEMIKFKNKDYYFSRDFNTKTNLKAWLKQQTEDKRKEYCKGILKKRIEEGKSFLTPTQVELRSIMSPPVQYYETLFGDYRGLCKSLGYENRFRSYPSEGMLNQMIKEGATEIAIDTREQKPIKFSEATIVKKLDYGDYTLHDEELAVGCYIERKSINDLIGTMSGGLERFKKEIERAMENESSIIVLVERNINECLAFDRLPYVSKKIKASPEFIFKNIRDLIQSYHDVQFLFVKGRTESQRIIKKLLFSGGSFQDYDLQLAYDLGHL